MDPRFDALLQARLRADRETDTIRAALKLLEAERK